MKQFDLKEFEKNPSQKVVTRDGREVRIICTDRKETQPIIALVTKNGKEEVRSYYQNGRWSNTNEWDLDLFFAPTKREGYINIYCNIYYEGSDKDRNTGKNIFSSEEEAKEHKDLGYITTIKIEWEE